MLRASTILGALEQAQTELVGKAVILTDGKAGTVEDVWLDEWHGLRISIKGHDGKWPISTLKFTQMTKCISLIVSLSQNGSFRLGERRWSADNSFRAAASSPG